MGNDPQAAYDEFLKLAAPNLQRQCNAIFACVYAETDKGWTNLAASVVLIPRGADLRGHVGARLFDVAGVRAMRVRVPGKKVAALLEGIANGVVPKACLPRGADEIQFAREEGIPYSIGGHGGVRDLDEYGLPFRGYVLQASGRSNAKLLPHERWAEASARLPACDPPFSDLTAVAQDLRIRNHFEHNDSTSFAIVAPIWLTLREAELNHASASIDVTVLSFWPDVAKSTTLSLLPDVEFLEHKKVMPVGDDTWSREAPSEGAKVFKKTMHIGEAIGAADLSLNYDGRQVEAVRVGLANARVVAHELVDPDFRGLRGRLFERRNSSDGDRHEEGVAWLLHLCGFSVCRYGYKDLQRATDVVAFFENFAAVYAECSLELPSAEKLKNIETRAEALRTRLKTNYGRGISLVRAIFVPQRRADLAPSEAAEAHKHARAIYICGDDQEQLLNMARRGESARTCFSFIAQRGREYATVAM